MLRLLTLISLLIAGASGYTQVFLDENFDSGIPGEWTITDGGDSNDTWYGATDYSGDDLDGTPFGFVDSDAAGSSVNMDEILESPAVSPSGYTTYYLSFDQYFRDFMGDEDADVQAWDGSAWQTVASFTGADYGSWSSPDNQIIDVTAHVNSNMKVRFHYYNANFDYYWAVDNVKIYGTGISSDDPDAAWPGDNLGTLSCPSSITPSDNTTSGSDDCSYISGADHIYNFTTDVQADVTVQTCGSAFDTKLYVYDQAEGDCSAGNYLYYNDDDCNLQSKITMNALPAGSYVIVLEGYLGAEGAYDLSIDVSNCGGDCPDCSNGIQDCQETGIDCGGPDCPPCDGYLHPTVGLLGTYNGGCMVPTCGGKYYDDGGSSGNYSSSVNYIYRTFCPDEPGKCLRATFNTFDVEPSVSGNYYDFMYVLNGPTQNSDVLFIGTGNMASDAVEVMEGSWTDGVYTSTDQSGCLTFRFKSDGSYNYAGWDVTFSCVDCSGPNGLDPNDCANSIEVCNNFDFTGASTGPGLSNDGCAGCVTSETYSNWYQFDVMSSGTLAMTVDPVTNSDDYDFALYQAWDCGTLGAPVRCSYAANYAAHCYNGVQDEDETGVDTGGADCPGTAPDGNTGMVDGAGDTSEDVGGDMWVEDISVTEGDTYYLLINNWSPDGDGFDVRWDLTDGASLGVQPKIEAAVNASNNKFEVKISEPVTCSSVSADGSDFVLDCTGSTTESDCLANSIIGANPLNCVNDTTSWIEITLADPLPQARAAYENDWKIVCSGANAVVDVCNNPLNGGNPDIILPVELVNFSAVCQYDAIEIVWATASETNNDFFTLERSCDGLLFTPLDNIQGAGTTSSRETYLYQDGNPCNGLNYYRLKQTDFDGKSSWSDVVHVTCESGINEFYITPNPFKDELFIFFDKPTEQTVTVEIYDMPGKKIFNSLIPVNSLKYRMNDIELLEPGTYYLKLTSDTGSKTEKLIKM